MQAGIAKNKLSITADVEKRISSWIHKIEILDKQKKPGIYHRTRSGDAAIPDRYCSCLRFADFALRP